MVDSLANNKGMRINENKTKLMALDEKQMG